MPSVGVPPDDQNSWQAPLAGAPDHAVRGVKTIGELFIGRLNNEEGRGALKQKLVEFLVQMQKEGAIVPSTDGTDPAFKVMRHDKIAYAKPLFLEEFNILAGLHSLEGLTPMLQAGYLKPAPGTVWPPEVAPLSKVLENP